MSPDDPQLAPNEWEIEEARWWRVCATPPLPFDLTIRVGVSGGRLACTGLRISSTTGISARDLRLIKLPDILAAAAEGTYLTDPDFSRAILGYDVRPTMKAAAGGRLEYDRVSSRRCLPRLYQEAMAGASRRRPTRHLAQVLHVSERTARRWVKRARELDLITDPPARERSDLPPTERGSHDDQGKNDPRQDEGRCA